MSPRVHSNFRQCPGRDPNMQARCPLCELMDCKTWTIR